MEDIEAPIINIWPTLNKAAGRLTSSKDQQGVKKAILVGRSSHVGNAKSSQ